MKKFEPEAIIPELRNYLNRNFKGFCMEFITFDHSEGLRTTPDTKALWDSLRPDKILFQQLSENLAQYIQHELRSKNPQAVVWLRKRLAGLHNRFEDLSSEATLNALFDKINKYAVKKGGTIEDFVDEDTGEVCTLYRKNVSGVFFIVNDEAYVCQSIFGRIIEPCRAVIDDALDTLAEKKTDTGNAVSSIESKKNESAEPIVPAKKEIESPSIDKRIELGLSKDEIKKMFKPLTVDIPDLKTIMDDNSLNYLLGLAFKNFDRPDKKIDLRKMKKYEWSYFKNFTAWTCKRISNNSKIKIKPQYWVSICTQAFNLSVSEAKAWRSHFIRDPGSLPDHLVVPVSSKFSSL